MLNVGSLCCPIGPGTYNPDGKEDPKTGLMVTRDRRFKDKRNENPGPGAYEVCPLNLIFLNFHKSFSRTP